ncbi:hypothetical protein AAVH_20251 [Aphelenchoides avenae]|nr:hypothetical protein AAVH_20251 [Aphelenchus avenae]
MSLLSPAPTNSRSTKRSAAAAAAQQFVATNPDSGANHVINLLCALLSSKLCDVSTQPPSSEPSAHELERQRSIVIAGLPEAPPNLSSAERNSLEVNAVHSLIDRCRPPPPTPPVLGQHEQPPDGDSQQHPPPQQRPSPPEISVVTAYRMGQQNRDRPRLLKVVLATRSMQRAFLAAARHLRLDPDFKDVFVRPSLTREQRDAEFRLREECRRRRDAGEKVHIYRGLIVQSGNLQRQPSNLR